VDGTIAENGQVIGIYVDKLDLISVLGNDFEN
jgi:hypothetical protein